MASLLGGAATAAATAAPPAQPVEMAPSSQPLQAKVAPGTPAEATLLSLASLLRLTLPPVPTSALPVPLPSPAASHVFLGSAQHARDRGCLVRLGITHVLNVAEDNTGTDHYDPVPPGAPPRESALYGSADLCASEIPAPLPGVVHFTGFSSQDAPNYPMLAAHFDDVAAFLDGVAAVNGRCLLHCLAGVNRSGVLAVAYVVRSARMPVLLAARAVKEARGRVCTNGGFQEQLVLFASERQWALE